MEESMETALARLRAKTDRELGILVARQLHRSRKLAARGAYHDAAKNFLTARALLAVANVPPAERTRLERLMHKVRQSIALPLTAKAVRQIAHRYIRDGLGAAVYAKQRPGAQEVLDGPQKQRIVAMVCSKPPEGRARWTVRLIAEE